ncbi:signal peptidase, endoplasmic reticulum-type [Georgenia satyanarayanai]|uniref:Signal peptidase I n=1 Tax=Georgenia satyanarayanai TaxID=860221 RepID=A0A2Y9BZY9_9MICO|nr:signal peptidase I [Georgenia satyanarayanai]PYF98327.1 signal peptidase [Georgenia satyanarayanai]SSA45212.1 signal peptidase, endoplasmic reticulum-type [Georgenia satyanarayanai]
MTLVATAPPRTRRRVRPRAGSVLRSVALATAVVLLWPVSLGGLFGGIIVSGHSMEPTMERGDLVVVMRVREAQVGDVVVFRPQVAPHARVVHRIVGADGEQLELRGDNNDWSDPFDVTQDDVVGKVVMRLPQVGGALSSLTDARVWASLLLLGAGLWLWPRRAPDGAP